MAVSAGFLFYRAASSASTRDAVVAYAKQFIGNPYVWGGTSLTNGADCSGFTKSVMAHFGVGLSRTSGAQANDGYRISVGSVEPGDLVFYASGGSIYHVAMYIGNGQIVHACQPQERHQDLHLELPDAEDDPKM
mgnify:CR=1 FL=1